jgi:hypothetical protein
LASALKPDDKDTIPKALNDTLAWIEVNKEAVVSVFEGKLK